MKLIKEQEHAFFADSIFWRFQKIDDVITKEMSIFSAEILYAYLVGSFQKLC